MISKDMKKKLLFVINTLGHAGAEVALLELLRNLDTEEYQVSLLVLMGQGELVHKLPSHVNLINEKFSDCSVLTPTGRRKMMKTMIKALFYRGTVFRRFLYLCSNLVRMIKRGKVMPDKLLWRVLADSAPRMEEEYDLAVAYLEGASAYYVADYVKARKKAAFVHIDYGRAGYDRHLDSNCYLKFDRIFTVSDEVKENFLKVYPEREAQTFVFHNLLDQEGIKEKAKEPGGFTDDYQGIRLLTVGRLTWQKAYEVAVDALYLIKKVGVDARWYVLGEGDQREMLEKKIEKLELQEDFLLLGAKSNPYPYFAQTDIYVHATRFEGKSIAIQEAQTLGCAIVASDCSGNREQIIDGEDGVLCELSPEKLKECIMQLAESPEKRKGFGLAASRKTIVHKEEMQRLTELLQ